MKLDKSTLLPVGALMITMISIQGGASLAKGLFASIGAEGTTAIRLTLGALMLTLVLRPWRTRWRDGNWRSVTLYGVVLGGMNLLFFMALNRVPLGIAAALQFTGPLAVAVGSSRRRIDFAWIILATAGLLLLTPIDASSHALDPVGVVFGLASGACWGLYIIVGKRAGAQHGAYTPAIGMIIAACVTLPIGLAHAGIGLFSPAILPIALIVAVLSSALPFSLEMYALRHMPAQTYGTLTSLEPAIGALSGLIFLHEALPPLQWLAIALIIIASIGTTLTMKPKPVLPV